MLATQSLNHHPYPPLPYSSASTTAAYASTGPLAAMNMYTMQPHHHHHHHHQQSPYAFAQPPQQQQQQQQAAPAPRQYGSQGTSSAFSASANPDEDWTKISDLAERRRIQNRIAQRNYRKKLKRRLEDLERRAGSPDSIESQKPSPKSNKRTPAATKAQKASQQKQQQQPKQRQSSASPVAQSPPSASVTVAPQPTKPIHVPHMQFTPPMETSDEFIMPSQYDDGRDPSHSPPPMYSSSSAAAMSSYSSYPPPDELLLNPYSTAGQPYPTMVTAGGDGGYASYLPTASAAPPTTTIPPMTHFSDAFKQRDSYGSDGGIGGGYGGGGYGFYTAMDVNGSSPYESNPHTPPLSHTFDHSANCSESGYEYPTTPLSMPGSPAMVQQL